MLVARGVIAFIVGLIASNQLETTPAALVIACGLWALAEGAATVWQGYPSLDTSRRADAQPVLLALGSVGLVAGVLAVAVTGLSAGVAIWVLAAWLAVRAGFEGLAALAARSKVRLAIGTAALIDLGLVALFVTHTTSSVASATPFGGGLIAVWGVLHLALGVMAKPVPAAVAAGPRLLSAR
jgi:uncharacterized membrane protein HdeD (DUF308 family)